MMTYLKKYNRIWDKVSADIKNNLTANLSIKKVLKTKIKSHGGEVTDTYDKEIPKVHSNHTCFTVIYLDSAVKKDENYYPQVFLKEWIYIKKKVIRHIIDDLENSSDHSQEADEE